MAHSLVNVANSMNIKTTAVISQMNEPLGRHVGNSLEGDHYLVFARLISEYCNVNSNAIYMLHLVLESLKCLRGDGPNDLEELVVKQGGIELLTMFDFCY